MQDGQNENEKATVEVRSCDMLTHSAVLWATGSYRLAVSFTVARSGITELKDSNGSCSTDLLTSVPYILFRRFVVLDLTPLLRGVVLNPS